MLHPDLATNPYALTAIVCTATFLVAPITLTVYRYAAFLTLITFHSLILCQYKCAPASCLPLHVLLRKFDFAKGRVLQAARPRTTKLLCCVIVQYTTLLAGRHIYSCCPLHCQAKSVPAAAVLRHGMLTTGEAYPEGAVLDVLCGAGPSRAIMAA